MRIRSMALPRDSQGQVLLVPLLAAHFGFTTQVPNPVIVNLTSKFVIQLSVPITLYVIWRFRSLIPPNIWRTYGLLLVPLGRLVGDPWRIDRIGGSRLRQRPLTRRALRFCGHGPDKCASRTELPASSECSLVLSGERRLGSVYMRGVNCTRSKRPPNQPGGSVERRPGLFPKPILTLSVNNDRDR